jgi:hypothetical protein
MYFVVGNQTLDGIALSERDQFNLPEHAVKKIFVILLRVSARKKLMGTKKNYKNFFY